MTERAQLNTVTYDAGTFTEETWNDLLNRLSNLLNFPEEKKLRFQKNRLARLIAAIPFLANCEGAYRTALSHLMITYLASHEAGKDIFLHNFSDNKSLMKRLEPISHFSGGNRDIIDRGMNLLAVIMLADHKKDSIMDQKNEKYNPVSSGIWKFDEHINQLEEKILSTECPGMDEIITFEDAKAIWWEYF